MAQPTVINPFRGKSSLVLHALMLEPNREWSGVELAKAMGMSVAWVNRILKTLEDERFVVRGGRGAHSTTKVIHPEKLLAKWLTHYQFKRHTKHLYFVQHKNPLKQLQKICQDTGANYLLTGYAAANHITPVIGDVPPMAYLQPPEKYQKNFRTFLAQLENIHGFIPVLKSANLIILEPHPSTPITKHKKDHTISPLQLYLDLHTMPADSYIINELSEYWKKHGIPHEV